MGQQPEKRISLLLSYYLDPMFSDVFGDIGFEVLWADNRHDTEKIIMQRDPDLAIEWQHGPDDYPIRDLLRRHGRRTPVILSLNWQGSMTAVPKEEGISGTAEVPSNLGELLGLFHNALSEEKRPALAEISRRTGIQIKTANGACANDQGSELHTESKKGQAMKTSDRLTLLDLPMDSLKNLVACKEKLAPLELRKAELERELASMTKEIAGIQNRLDSARTRTRVKVRQRERIAQPSLAFFVVDILKKTKKALSVNEIHDLLLKEENYKTQAKDFKANVRILLYTNKGGLFKKEGKGIFGLVRTTSMKGIPLPPKG